MMTVLIKVLSWGLFSSPSILPLWPVINHHNLNHRQCLTPKHLHSSENYISLLFRHQQLDDMKQTSTKLMAKRQKQCSSEWDKNCPAFPPTPFSLIILQSQSLTLSEALELSSTAHCPWRTSSVKLSNPATTSSIKLVPSGSVGFHQGYSETGPLVHSVTPQLLQRSPFGPACFLCP